MTEILNDYLKQMAANLNKQDNYGTAHPVYFVQCYRKAAYSRCMNVKSWMNEQAFFTEKAAIQHIKNNARFYDGKLRIYTGTGNNNPEWKAIREFLKGNKSCY